MENEKIVIYQTPDGNTSLEVTLDQDTVWLTQAQIIELFQSSKANISEHIKHIYKSGELEFDATVRKFRTVRQEGKRQVTRELEHYSLDIILSVGYRVNSKRGTQFRKWANKVLKDYLVKGYALNEKRLNEQSAQFIALKQTVKLLGNIVDKKHLTTDEASGLLKVLTDYTYALDILDKYDHRKLTIDATRKNETYIITYQEAMSAIQGLREKFGGSTLFANEKDQSFRAPSLQFINLSMVQTFILALKKKKHTFFILL